MVDLVALASLFVDVFGAAKGWTEPKVAVTHPLDEIRHEKAYRDIIAKGHSMAWKKETSLRRLKQEGWKPVMERDVIGRPTIFMDRNKELLLMHRPSQG